jgi:hypothetical protein
MSRGMSLAKIVLAIRKINMVIIKPSAEITPSPLNRSQKDDHKNRLLLTRRLAFIVVRHHAIDGR